MAAAPVLSRRPALVRSLPLLALPVVVMTLLGLGVVDDYNIHVMTTMLIWSILALSVSSLFAYAGLLSMAHGALFGIGVYSVALLTKYHFAVSFWIAMLAGMVVAMVLGLAVGAVTVRMRSHYFVIGTLALGMVVQVTTETWTSVTAGPKGVAGIPKPSAIGPLDPKTPEGFCILVTLVLTAGMFAMSQLKVSPIGRAWGAMRDNELLASSVGVEVPRYRLLCFAVSATLASASGSLYAVQTSYISPADVSFDFAFRAITMGLVGGLSWIFGPVVGAIVLIGIPEFFRGGDYDRYRTLIEGVLLIVVMLFLRQGVLGGLAELVRTVRRRLSSPAPVAAAAVEPPESSEPVADDATPDLTGTRSS